jgi:hypothetical protein
MGWAWAILFMILVGLRSGVAGVFPNYFLAEGDQDVRLQIDNRASSLAIGDIDGDGFPDAVLSTKGDSTIRPSLALIRGNGGRWPRQSSVTELTTTHVILNLSEEFLGLVDLNGDNRQDLVIWGPSTLQVIWGVPEWPLEKDLAVPGATLTIGFSPFPFLVWKGLAVGDVNGDGVSDFLFQFRPHSTGVSEVKTNVIFGNKEFPNAVNSSDPHYVHTWEPYPGAGSVVMNVNNDKFDDIFVSADNGQTVVFGSSNPLNGYDVTTATSAVRLIGMPGSVGLSSPFMTNRAGEDRRDFGFAEYAASYRRWYLVDSAALANATGTVVISSLAPQLLRETSNAYGSEMIVSVGDFNGDGQTDFVTRTLQGLDHYVYKYYLEYEEGLLPTDQSFSVHTEQDSALTEVNSLLADWDGDGKLDWFIWEVPNPRVFVQTLDVIFGFEPLKNPSIRVLDRDPGSKRAILELTVEGEPEEMKLSGDIHDNFRDQWIPYEQRQRISLTSSPGSKTVTALFRIALGRESSPVSIQLDVSTSGPRVVAVTNRLKGAGREAEIDCRVAGGRLRATVYERGGRRVKTVADEEVSGVVTVRWDGRNDGGELARPGVYVMALEFDGRIERTEILLEP